MRSFDFKLRVPRSYRGAVPCRLEPKKRVARDLFRRARTTASMSSLTKLADVADVFAFGLTVRRQILRKRRARADNLTPAEEDPASFRNSVAEKYRQDTGPRLSCGEDNEMEAFLMLRRLVKVVNSGALKNVAHAPDGTKALLLAMCMPFCKACGYAGPLYALQPFMVWEQREVYRLFIGVFLHQDLLHLVSNLCSLADSGSFLEEHCGTATLIAATASLTASSSALEGEQDRYMAFKGETAGNAMWC